MAVKRVVTKAPCASCGETVSDADTRTCLICRTDFCYNCAVEGYGREFCSNRCREYFFHGDDDDVLE